MVQCGRQCCTMYILIDSHLLQRVPLQNFYSVTPDKTLTFKCDGKLVRTWNVVVRLAHLLWIADQQRLEENFLVIEKSEKSRSFKSVSHLSISCTLNKKGMNGIQFTSKINQRMACIAPKRLKTRDFNFSVYGVDNLSDTT